MTDPLLLRRIRTNPEIFGGKPIIRDLRISVELILRACLAYANAVVADESLEAVRVARR
jgi:uncharacterized protein (DUF433 family)